MDHTQTSVPPAGNPAAPQPPEVTCSVRLSERDEAAVMAAAETPPAPNEAAL
jgi:hypothetical protein